MQAPIQQGIPITFVAEFVNEAGQPIDLSAATATWVKLENPDGVVTKLAAAFVSDGTDGKVQSPAGPGVLGAAGQWRWQALAEIGGGVKHTAREGFEVLPNIPEP